MHDTAYEIGQTFLDVYWSDSFRRILDVGSRDVNGTLRDFCPPNAEYVGIDLEPGASVDVVLKHPASFPFDDASFDIVLSTSCFEHDQMFWLTFAEMGRVLRPGGYIYINVPSNGMYHSYPYDNWRFYPDSGLALEAWAKKLGLKLKLLETFTARRKSDVWNDLVMVFRKAGRGRKRPPRYLCDYFPDALNIRRSNVKSVINFSDSSEDMLLLKEREGQIKNLLGQLEATRANLAEQKQQVDDLNEVITERDGHITKLNQTITKRDERITSLAHTVSERDAEARELWSKLQAQEARAEEAEAGLAERDAEAKDLAAKLEAQEARAEKAEAGLAERDAEAKDLAAKLQAQEARAEEAEAGLAERDGRIEALSADLETSREAVAERDLVIRELRNSTSWRITAPLRFVRRAPHRVVGQLRRNLSTGARTLYRRTPLPFWVKLQIKDMLFRHAALLFRHTVAYRDWEKWLPPKTLPDHRLKNACMPDTSILALSGQRTWNPDARTVVLCAHAADRHLFGAERSLLDVAEGFATCGFNVVVTIPQNNKDYIHKLQEWSQSVQVFRYSWWMAGRPVDEATVEAFAKVFRESRADAIHVNTIMLREPLVAAKRLSIPSVVHVRELVEFDKELVQIIGEPPQDIIRKVLDSANYVVANSATGGKTFATANRTFVVPNTVDVAGLDIPNIVDSNAVRFALISSNIPKKGLSDCVHLARLCETRGLQAQFVLVGPDNGYINNIGCGKENDGWPENLVFTGYQDSPREAIEQANVVLNLSNFAESFGRTVLEAMAARRPVIAYDWGALSELVRHGETGFLIPYQQPEAAVEFVERLTSDQNLLFQMGEAGRKVAVEQYSKERYAEKLGHIYHSIFESKVFSKECIHDMRGSSLILRETSVPPSVKRARSLSRPDHSVETGSPPLRIAYFMWHFPVPSETFVLNELRILVAKGYDILVFCRQSPHPDFIPDFPIHWECVSSPVELAALLVRTQRHIVHAHFTYPTVTEFVWPACEKAGIPFTFIAHAQDIFRYDNDARNRVAEVVRSKMCCRVLVPSRFHREYLMERGIAPDKIVVNPNGVDPILFREGYLAERFRRPLRKICSVHRFVEKKGLEHLINAAKILESDGIEVHLYGYGELQTHYEEVVAAENIGNVYIHGPVKGREELLEVFRGHDLFACPSVRASDGDMDGVPTVLMDAMAAGLPVLATPISGIPELVMDGITGLHCEASPEAIAAAIRRFYGMPDARVAAIIENATHHLWDRFNCVDRVNVLLRIWEGRTIDLVIVSWNNYKELQQVIRRIYTYTSLPFHLVVCDNASDLETVSLLEELYTQKDNLTLIHNGHNALVGPGTNRALDASWSDYAIYICGKEGFVLAPGWEIPFITYMNSHPEVGLAGTLSHSPSYLTGKDYPDGVREFSRFRNPEFALQHPDRVFRHVQGGLFAIRRTMYEEIGGFSEAVPHTYTDVEYSYYVESRGWKLGEVPHILALYNKTRPNLWSRVDESIFAVHPPTLQELPLLDAIADVRVAHCNLCHWHGERFAGTDGEEICPSCRSTPRNRTFYRWLAASMFPHRDLSALAVNLPSALVKIWKQNFRGPVYQRQEFVDALKRKGQVDGSPGKISLAYLVDAFDATEDDCLILREVDRLLAPGGMVVVQNRYDVPSAPIAQEGEPLRYGTIIDLLASVGYRQVEEVLYRSAVLKYDWSKLVVFVRNKNGNVPENDAPKL